MNRLLFRFASVALAASTAVAQPLPVAPAGGQPPNPPQAEEWVKQMRLDAMKFLEEAEAALARGDEKTALNRYTAAHEMYKGALYPEELQKLGQQITELREKHNIPDHNLPLTPPKTVNLDDPAIAAKRTDALRLVSEADQYLEEGKFMEAGKLFTRIYSRYNDALLSDEEARVTNGLMTARERLGLPPMPAGQVDFMPYVVRSGDEEIDALCLLYSGSFATDAQLARSNDTPVTFNSAAVQVDGLTNAVYFEVARADDVPNPFRQGVFTFYRMDQQLRLRVLDIPTKGLRDAVACLWTVPDVFPALSLDSLTVNADLVVSRNDDGSGYSARTTGRVPTTRGGAILMTSQVRINADGIRIDDRGYDANGAEVWRTGTESGLMFKRAAVPSIVNRLESGLVVIDLTSGSGSDQLKRGGEVALHFSCWSATGNVIYTSRVGDNPPQRVRYPVNFIKGMNDGLENITVGTRRRLVVPPDLAWGAQGNSWQVPPNTPVVFDIECLWVQAPLAPPPIPGAGQDQGPPAPSASPGPRATPPAGRTGGGH